MPGTRCTVALCNNSLQETRTNRDTQHIQYHRFPLDGVLCNTWKSRTHRDGKWNQKTCRTCSVHFSSDDYERDLKSELLGLPGRKVLKKTAVPSLFLRGNETEQDQTRVAEVEKRLKRQQRRTCRREVANLLTAATPIGPATETEEQQENISPNVFSDMSSEIVKYFKCHEKRAIHAKDRNSFVEARQSQTFRPIQEGIWCVGQSLHCVTAKDPC